MVEKILVGPLLDGDRLYANELWTTVPEMRKCGKNTRNRDGLRYTSATSTSAIRKRDTLRIYDLSRPHRDF